MVRENHTHVFHQNHIVVSVTIVIDIALEDSDKFTV